MCCLPGCALGITLYGMHDDTLAVFHDADVISPKAVDAYGHKTEFLCILKVPRYITYFVISLFLKAYFENCIYQGLFSFYWLKLQYIFQSLKHCYAQVFPEQIEDQLH